ncbi:hypothetical protein FSP39_017294, partial [Pinctada imbricata]
ILGFGPFGEHKVNASWVAVQRLAEFGVKDDVELVTREIPVDYDMVKEIICSLWEEEKPDLVVLVGVSGIAKVITIEQQAHNDGYCRKDVKGLSNDPTCSAFIHVPPLGAPYTADQLAQGLRIAIIEMLRQIQ